MKDNINHQLLKTEFYTKGGINFPNIFGLDNYYTDTEIALIKNKTPKLSFFKKSWYSKGPLHIHIADECPCCKSKDIRQLNPYVLDQLVSAPVEYINTFQFIKWCPKCNWCNSTEIHCNFEY